MRMQSIRKNTSVDSLAFQEGFGVFHIGVNRHLAHQRLHSLEQACLEELARHDHCKMGNERAADGADTDRRIICFFFLSSRVLEESMNACNSEENHRDGTRVDIESCRWLTTDNKLSASFLLAVAREQEGGLWQIHLPTSLVDIESCRWQLTMIYLRKLSNSFLLAVGRDP